MGEMSPRLLTRTSTRGPSSPRRACAWDVSGLVVDALVEAEPGPEDWAGISFSRSGMLVVMAFSPVRLAVARCSIRARRAVLGDRLLNFPRGATG